MSVDLGGKSRCVHELVLITFVGPRPKGLVSRHLNGVPSDNRLANLEWATRRRNHQDMKWHNGSRGHKLTGVQAAELKACLRLGETRKSVAKRFGVSVSLCDKVRAGISHGDA